MNRILILIASVLIVNSSYSQNIGIGTTNPKARLHVLDSSVVFSADLALPVNQGNPPIVGPGRRMMWYADKAAFRAGAIVGDHWDKHGIGNYSFAAGFNVIALGVGSFAAGFGAIALGDYSISIGKFCYSGDQQCVTIGNGCSAE